MKALVFGVLLLATPAFALDPERRDVTVISGRLWDGYKYGEMFLPSNHPVLTLMAGQDNAISFVETQEYYWPLSRQVYVDFESRRDPISGTLRIERDGNVVAEVEEQPFVIEYPEGAVNGDGRLLWGGAAEATYQDYKLSEAAFNRSFVQAQRAQTAYEQALLEAARAGSKEQVPPPPPLPEPGLRLVTAPSEGFRLSLEPGAYRMALVRDGQTVAGTERALRVIAVISSGGLVADVLPEERWTRPIPSNTQEARIYARAGSIFYMTMAEATRFRESDYMAVVSPQTRASEDRDIWVRRKPAGTGELSLSHGATEETLARTSFKVEQTSSSGFGYKVRPAVMGETADIDAFAVTIPTEGSGRLQISVPNSDFTREVVAVAARSAGAGFLLALLPLAAFLGFSLMSRRRRPL